jgi:outer membrane protein
MTKLLISASFIAAAVLPAAAQAQAIPAAVVAVVDLDKVTSQCNACKTAAAALRSQITGLQSRVIALATPQQTQCKSKNAAVDCQ